MIKKLNKNKKARTLVTFLCVLISALSQAYVIQVFIQPANLLSSGFTGVAILIEKITSTYFGFSFSTSLGMIVLNVPVAILCYKNISPRFTLFSLLQVFLASLFLKVCQFQPLFNDILLNITGASVARCYIVPIDILPARVNQHVCIIRCKEIIHPIFLHGVITNKEYQNHLLKLAGTGATREAINKQQIESLDVIFPPIELQNQFADFVKEVDKSRFIIKSMIKEGLL